MPTDNSVTLVGNVTRDPELRFTNTGQANVDLRAGRQPPLAEPPDPGVGGGHLASSTWSAGARWPRT